MPPPVISPSAPALPLDLASGAGPAARALIECAAAAQIARDAVEATLLFKRLAPGLRLVDLAPPLKRPDVEALVAEARRRAAALLADWARRRDMPAIEVQAGVATYERCASAEMEGVLKDLVPLATPRETLLEAIRAAGERCDCLHDDVVARDVGWALAETALAAAESLAEELRALGLRAVR